MASPDRILIAEVDERRVAFPAASVDEVLAAVSIVPLPGASAFVEGVIDRRGEVLAVVDLRARLGLAARPLHPDDHLIVLRTRERRIVVRVDRARDLRTVGAGDLQDAGPVARGAVALAGVARFPDGLVVVHDVDAFLSQAEADTLAHALATR